LQVLVIAAPLSRRSMLAEMVRSTGQFRIATSPGISLERVFQIQIAADVVLVDVDGQELASAVLRMAAELPDGVGVIVLADNPEPRWVMQSVKAGVNAILPRAVAPDELSLAIQAAEAGLVLLHPTSVQRLEQNFVHEQYPDDAVEALTSREREVLGLVSDGLGNKEIAARLNISEHTAKFHISSILGKLGAASRAEAVSQGIRRGLITV